MLKAIKKLFHTGLLIGLTVALTAGCKKKGTEATPDPVVTPDPPKPPVTQVTPVSLEFTEMLSANSEKKRLQLNWLATDFAATGLYVPDYATLKVHVERTAGTQAPQLLIGTYSRYNGWNSQPSVMNLKAGENEFLFPAGGLIWVRYTSNAPTSKAKLTFKAGFKPVPHYIYGKTTNQQWRDMLSSMATVPDVILEGEKCYIVASLQAAVNYQQENQDKLLEKISSIIKIEDDYSGLDGSSSLHTPNVHQKYLLTQHEDPTYYMFAYNYRTAYIHTAIQAILKPDQVTWGPWHELGHLHQQIWTWPAITEVTVNIFSREVQRRFTPAENRLVTDKVWERVPGYLAKADKDFNSDASVGTEYLWVRLCMFEQLRLAFGDNFYPRLLKKVREDKPALSSDGQKMDYFMKLACEISGRDLSDYFKKWGLNTSSSVYSTMANMGLPKPASDISLLRD